jgi:hypothetical protein
MLKTFFVGFADEEDMQNMQSESEQVFTNNNSNNGLLKINKQTYISI